MILYTLKNSRSSSNKSDIIFRYAVLTAAVMLILSFALKTAGQIFYSVFAVLLLGAGLFIGLIRKDSGILITVILLALFCFRIISVFSFSVNASYKYDGIREKIVAVVTNTPTISDSAGNYAYCIASVKESERDLLSNGDRVLLTGDEVMNLSLGDKISADVMLSDIRDSQNHRAFYSENVFLRAKLLDNTLVDEESKGIYSLSLRVRKYAQQVLMKCTENSGMLLAVITGERSYIGEALYNEFCVAGVSHILVVSGMHFVILCGIFIKLLSLFKIPELLKDFLLLIFLFMMMCICGFSMSILRASTVYVFTILYRRLNRLPNSILTLSNAVILVLFIHPFAVFSVAFLLSFSSTFGILVLSERIMEFINRRVTLSLPARYVAEAAAVSLSAYIATLPVVIYHFGYISTYAVLTNVLISFVSTLMLVLSAVGVILGEICVVSNIVLWVADLLAHYFVYVVKLINSLPLSTIPIRNKTALSIVIIIVFVAVYIIKAKPQRFFKKG